MSSTHLSELCKNGDVEQITDRLRHLRSEHAEAAEEDASDVPTPGFTEAMDTQMRNTFDGIWGYQDDDGRTALHWSIAMLNFSLAHTLLAAPHHALADSVDLDGASPFTTACAVGAADAFLAELLTHAAAQRRWRAAKDTETDTADATVYKLAIVNQPDHQGNTPLLHTASRARIGTVRLLLTLGADMDHANKRGQTALHRAASRGSQDVVEELVFASLKHHDTVAHRRWINAQDYRGDTALFYASADENEELGRFLLRHGADRNIRNKDGKEFWEV